MSSESNRRRRRDITGQRFTKLVAVNYCEDNSKWKCRCDCGQVVFVNLKTLNSGNTKSCGCTRRQALSSAMKARHSATRVEQGLDPDTPLSSDNHIERLAAAPTMKSVMVRDDYTCAWCSDRGVDLSVHHIETWAANESRRLDRTNLITLCKPCHLKVHRDNYAIKPDPIMSILLEGYAKIKENL